jgi:multicomponent Na+:H+ antiporter subunit C
MIWPLVLAVWVSVTAGVYLALSRDVLRCVLGLSVLASATNLVLLASGRIESDLPPVVPVADLALAGAANPLPQALVLTAIVIGFALVCFALALVLRLIQDAGTDDALALRHAEPPATDPLQPALCDCASGSAVGWHPEDPSVPGDDERGSA